MRSERIMAIFRHLIPIAWVLSDGAGSVSLFPNYQLVHFDVPPERREEFVKLAEGDAYVDLLGASMEESTFQAKKNCLKEELAMYIGASLTSISLYRPLSPSNSTTASLTRRDSDIRSPSATYRSVVCSGTVRLRY